MLQLQRCVVEVVVADRSFNSLFEMRLLEYRNEIFNLKHVSILYLRCRIRDKGGVAHRPHVSILYLRCWSLWLTSPELTITGFNSLFEMHYPLVVTDIGISVEVSILYLRCEDVAREVADVRHSWLVSILYLRCRLRNH